MKFRMSSPYDLMQHLNQKGEIFWIENVVTTAGRHTRLDVWDVGDSWLHVSEPGQARTFYLHWCHIVQFEVVRG